MPTVNNSTRAGALAAYRSYNQAAAAIPSGWTGRVTGCVAGAPSADARAAILTTINYYRSMVHLAPARLDATWNAKAQQSALMMEANNSLSHNPPSTWKCYSAAGADAARSGNLYLSSGTSNGARAVNAYIDDSGNEATMGHRRWLLHPAVTVLGAG